MIKNLVLIAVVSFTSVYGVTEKETLPIGTRALTLFEHNEHQELRAKHALVEGEQLRAVIDYETTHEGAIHHPNWVSPLGDQLQLEDGTLWSVAFADRKKTFEWYTDDVIVITPNHSWFSCYHYRVRNLTRGDNVRVNISPPQMNVVLNTRWIVQIDPENNELCLQDGSVWVIAAWDASLLNKWKAGDRILIGCNDSWFSRANPNILINLETMNYAVSRCIY